MNRRGIAPILIAAACGMGIAALGASATNIGPWYYSLAKPAWQPPDWLFGPAWTLIFGLAALSGVLAWRAAPSAGKRRLVLVLFAVNALVNVLWSELFFGQHRPDWALIEVVPFWLSILVLMVALAPISSTSSRVLWPYLLWVTFAAALNLATVHLNGPFGA